MNNEFVKALRIIKALKIESPDQYKKLLKDFSLLSLNSLKYMSQKKDFKEIIKMAEELN